MPSQQDIAIGQNFDLLDRNVAAQWTSLSGRSFITQGDYDAWYENYSALQYFAGVYSNVAYVASQWRDEQPRYNQMIPLLQNRIRVGDPRNYDTAVHINGVNGCCCEAAEGTGGIGGINIASGGTNLSLGDTLRGALQTPAQRILAETGNDVLKGIITALVVGAVLWIVHRFMKNKKKKAG
jgi:hypothetical protein